MFVFILSRRTVKPIQWLIFVLSVSRVMPRIHLCFHTGVGVHIPEEFFLEIEQYSIWGRKEYTRKYRENFIGGKDLAEILINPLGISCPTGGK